MCARSSGQKNNILPDRKTRHVYRRRTRCMGIRHNNIFLSLDPTCSSFDYQRYSFSLRYKICKKLAGKIYCVCWGYFCPSHFSPPPAGFFSFSLQMVCKYDIVGVNEVFLPLASLQIIRVRLWIRTRRGLDNNYCTSQFSANNIFGFFVFFCSSLFPGGGRRQ